MKPGISFLHGGHQVAQKSNRMTLPRNELKSTCLPLRSLIVKFRFATFPPSEQTASAVFGSNRIVPIIRIAIVVFSTAFLYYIKRVPIKVSSAGGLMGHHHGHTRR